MNQLKKLAVGIIVAALSSGLALAASCPGKLKKRTGPNGKTLTLCFDGKYSTCLRDARRLGWSYDQSKRFCDSGPLKH